MLKAVKRSRSQGLGVAGMVGRRDAGFEVEGTHAPLGQGPGSVSATALRLRAQANRLDTQGTQGPQNAAVPPVVFPGGRNPYLDRPLPPPPPPKTPKTPQHSIPITVAIPPAVPAMPARPSTSSGPSSNKTAPIRPNFEKRLSKDDMSLTGQMGMSMRRTKTTSSKAYRFLGLPTPEPSPKRMRTPPPVFSVPSRIATPDTLSSGEIQIGMALGSPTADEPSPLAKWQSIALTPPQDAYSPLLPQQRTPEPPVQRQKTQKRKFFGSLFGSRKQAEPAKIPEPAAMSYSTSSAAASNSSLNRSGEPNPLRSNTVTGNKAPKFTPIVTRSKTEPWMEDAVQESARIKPEIKEINPQQTPAETAVPSISLNGPGLLDVEIPDIRLERYSIMFSGVLNPEGSSTISSLLARRQATLEKLKTINDKITIEESGNKGLQRRATTPHSAKSPSFSLFPPPQGLRPGSSPRSRSNTSPALMVSPVRGTFEHEVLPFPEPRLRKERKTVTILSPRAMDERNRAANVEKLREQQVQMQKAQQARPADRVFGPEESALLLDSPMSVSDVEEIVTDARRLPLKPKLQEPQWEIISPPGSTSTASEASSVMTKRTGSSVSSSASSVQTNTTRPSIDAEADAEDDDPALKAAVEISIARQISISRQQRSLLQTTTTGPPAAGAGKMARSASAKANPMGKGVVGRVVETKQAMPMLVDMHFGRNRKSERIVLEAA